MAGHDVAELYRNLPDSLRAELLEESRSFAHGYAQFRSGISGIVNTDRQLAGQVNWSEIRRAIFENSYTAFLDGTDPGRAQLGDDWLERALRETRNGEYHRYSPEESRDEYPVRPIHSGLMLGRFFYEHLLPVPLRNRI